MLRWFSKRYKTKDQQEVDNINLTAQKEIAREAAKIITPANQEVTEIKSKTEIKAKKKSDDILHEVTVKEAKADRTIHSPVESAILKPTELMNDEFLTPQVPEELSNREEIKPVHFNPNEQPVYIGDVELAIGAPVDLRMIAQLYDSLQVIPQLRILRTSGSVKQGATITITLEKPMPLISILSSRLPDVQAVPVSPAKEGKLGEASGIQSGKKKGIKTIELILGKKG